MERGLGSIKRLGRDEPMWIAIHKCMEAMLGISLYSYLYLKLAKTPYFFLIMSYVFSSTKSKRAEQVLSESGGWGGAGSKQGRGGPNNVYTCE
jgi:hypothetical protein